MNRLLLVLLTVLLGAAAGCPRTAGMPALPGRPAAQATPASDSAPAEAASRPAADPPLPPGCAYHVIASTRMVILQLPAGTLNDSEHLWSCLNEEPLTRADSALGVNGIRAGLGRAGDWPEVVRVLQEMAGQQVSFKEVRGEPGTPLPITLKQHEAEQTMFLYRPDGTMAAKDFPAGDNLLLTTTFLNMDDLSSVLYSVVPVVRSSKTRSRYVETPTGYMIDNAPDYFPIPALEFKLRVPAGSFVLIAPNGHARKRYLSPGYYFLTHAREGQEFDTVLVLFPQSAKVVVRE